MIDHTNIEIRSEGDSDDGVRYYAVCECGWESEPARRVEGADDLAADHERDATARAYSMELLEAGAVLAAFRRRAFEWHGIWPHVLAWNLAIAGLAASVPT